MLKAAPAPAVAPQPSGNHAQVPDFTSKAARSPVDLSAENKPAAQIGGIETDESMLRCLFEGPSLGIQVPLGERPANAVVEHFKSDCPGGLYRRLNLPVTIAPFVLSIPDGFDHPGSTWQAIVTCPSFSGLGFFPQLRWTYRIEEDRADTSGRAIEIACDTTLTHIRATLPNGETVDIIADRIRIRGSLVPCRGLHLFHEGKIEIEEEIRYVRPALDSSVLGKRCDSEIIFAAK